MIIVSDSNWTHGWISNCVNQVTTQMAAWGLGAPTEAVDNMLTWYARLASSGVLVCSVLAPRFRRQARRAGWPSLVLPSLTIAAALTACCTVYFILICKPTDPLYRWLLDITVVFPGTVLYAFTVTGWLSCGFAFYHLYCVMPLLGALFGAAFFVNGRSSGWGCRHGETRVALAWIGSVGLASGICFLQGLIWKSPLEMGSTLVDMWLFLWGKLIVNALALLAVAAPVVMMLVSGWWNTIAEDRAAEAGSQYSVYREFDRLMTTVVGCVIGCAVLAIPWILLVANPLR
jgi:hypothetical protein